MALAAAMIWLYRPRRLPSLASILVALFIWHDGLDLMQDMK
jgi:hypothetical protein